MILKTLALYFEKKENRHRFKGKKYHLWSVDYKKYEDRLPDVIYLDFNIFDELVRFVIKEKEFESFGQILKVYNVSSKISKETEVTLDNLGSYENLFEHLKRVIENYVAEEVEKEQRANNTLDKDWSYKLSDYFENIDKQLKEAGY